MHNQSSPKVSLQTQQSPLVSKLTTDQHCHKNFGMNQEKKFKTLEANWAVSSVLSLADLWSFYYSIFSFPLPYRSFSDALLAFDRYANSVAIKSLSVIFFFLLAFVNNQIYEIDLLTAGRRLLPLYSMFQLVCNIIRRHNSKSNRDNSILKKASYR